MATTPCDYCGAEVYLVQIRGEVLLIDHAGRLRCPRRPTSSPPAPPWPYRAF